MALTFVFRTSRIKYNRLPPMIDLINCVTVYRENKDGTIERCPPIELIGKDLEVVSVRDYSFQDIKNDYLAPNN